MEAWGRGSSCVLYRGSRLSVPASEPAPPPMSLVLDIGQGAGLAGASGVRPFLPPLLAGALARADAGIDFDGSGWQFLESPAFLLAVVALARACRSRPNVRGRTADLVARGTAVLAVVLGALLFAGSLAAGGHPAVPGADRGRGGGAAGVRGGRAGCSSAPAAGSTRAPRGCSPCTPTPPRWPRRRGDLRGAGRLPGGRGVRASCSSRRGSRATASTRACGSSLRWRLKKLVLAVIDALDPRALERAVEEDRAPALKALMENGTYVDDCVSTFPSITPVAASAIATGLGPADHLVPSMNWYHRGEERYVEYGSSFAATRTFGIFRSLTDTVYNMNLAHLTQEHRTVHEYLDDAGLRTACTTYLIYRGPPPPRAVEGLALQPAGRGRAVQARRVGLARAVLRRHLRLARHRLLLHARDARAARPPRRLRGLPPRGERPVRLPAVLAAGQRHLLAPGRPREPAGRRSPRPTARSAG